ncbi:hypothetical protein [Marinifilum flexuosum]|uniref:hypothetical protein n=1 Tax=Marinifilum flexuosum TaxID=1117708 RepID=UPI002491B583|nr:hypothetical protein [Marinifilum flexuosum]
MTEKQIGYSFITREEYDSALKLGTFKSLTRLELYNELQLEEHDRTVFLSIDSTVLNKVKQRIVEIRNFEFHWAKSFSQDITINEN